MAIAGCVEVLSRTARRRARRSRYTIAAAALAGAWTLGAAPACADESLRLGVQWEKFAEVIRTGGESLLPEMGWRFAHDEQPVQDDPIEDARGVGMVPRVSLVARDWSGAGVLLGHLSPTDQIRLSHSSRMLITRVRATEGRLVPFAQVGVGQWRIDTDVLPTFRPDVEIAGQSGVGFELALAPSISMAVETDYTILYREQHEPQMVCKPRLWGSFLAARGKF